MPELFSDGTACGEVFIKIKNGLVPEEMPEDIPEAEEHVEADSDVEDLAVNVKEETPAGRARRSRHSSKKAPSGLNTSANVAYPVRKRATQTVSVLEEPRRQQRKMINHERRSS